MVYVSLSEKCCGTDLFRPVPWGSRMSLVSGDSRSNPDSLTKEPGIQTGNQFSRYQFSYRMNVKDIRISKIFSDMPKCSHA